MSVIHQFEKILSDSRAVCEKAAGGDRDHGQTGAGKFFVTEETGPGTGRDANILALGDYSWKDYHTTCSAEIQRSHK